MANIQWRDGKWIARYRLADGKERQKRFVRRVDAEQWLLQNAVPLRGLKSSLSARSIRQRAQAVDTFMDRTRTVYYVGNGDLVKIGVASDLPRRVAALYPAVLLATEPGGLNLERERHRQFAVLRVKYEWFRYEGALKRHVEALQRAALAGPPECCPTPETRCRGVH